MKKSFFIYLIILSCLFLGCSKKVTKIPDGVFTREQMVRVLIDVHLLESKIKKLRLKQDSSEVLYKHYEDLLFADLQINREDYERSVEFYMDNIKGFSKIYDEVSDSLLARSKSGDFQ